MRQPDARVAELLTFPAGRPVAGLPRPASLHERVAAFYHDYAAVIAAGDLAGWASCFTDDCLYRITTAGNVEQGRPGALVVCQGGQMVEDWASIVTIRVSRPRRVRLLLSGIQVTGVAGASISARADFLSIQTLRGELPRLVMCGESVDEIEEREIEEQEEDGRGGRRLRFRRRLCVADNDVVDTSLGVPV